MRSAGPVGRLTKRGRPVDTVTLCVCGCGEPAAYAALHCNTRPRARLTQDNYTVEERGYSTPCWMFKNPRRGGHKPAGKYNTVRIGGKEVYAHRAMYEQEVGPIPDGLVIDHLCRESRCIRPDHLEPVTDAENVRRGSRPKISLEIARIIRSQQGIRSARALAREYRVTEFLIYQVWQGKIWRED